MEGRKDEYGRIIECPKCQSHEFDVEVEWCPPQGGFIYHYKCRYCNYRGKKEDFRAVPAEADNPSRR